MTAHFRPTRLRRRGQCGPEVSATGLGCRRMFEFPLPLDGCRPLQIEHKRASENKQVEQPAMIPLARCAERAGLDSSELFINSAFSSKHKSLLLSYLFNLKRGPIAVREMIVADIRLAIDLGASKRAADLLLVLRAFLSVQPEARIDEHSTPNRRRRQYRFYLAGRPIAAR